VYEVRVVGGPGSIEGVLALLKVICIGPFIWTVKRVFFQAVVFLISFCVVQECTREEWVNETVLVLMGAS